jgi:hypothetical protein
MKLGSRECNEALKNYVTSNLAEELMIELLLIPKDAENDVWANMTYKICDSFESDEEIEALVDTIKRIEKELGIVRD